MSRPRTRTRPQARTALVPAGARANGFVLTDPDGLLHAEAIETFAKAVGGRERLADTLAVAGVSSEIEQITTLLLDPRYATWTLSRLCRMAGITVAQLFAAYRKASFARAHIEASHTIATRLPAVVSDVMDKALSDPTVERHKLALEVGQLLEKKGGLIVQQNNLAQTAIATGPGSLEQLQQAVGDVLFGPRRTAVAVDPVPDPTEPDDPEDEDDPLDGAEPGDPAGPPDPDAAS